MMGLDWSLSLTDFFVIATIAGGVALAFIMMLALHSWWSDWQDAQEDVVIEPISFPSLFLFADPNEQPMPAPKLAHPSQYSGECIPLTTTEVLSQYDRVWWAEQMILQIPYQHPDRNAWLMNYGRSAISIALRAQHSVVFDDTTKAARLS